MTGCGEINPGTLEGGMIVVGPVDDGCDMTVKPRAMT